MARQEFKPGRPYVKLNHPAQGDIVSDPAHVAGYGTGFEGNITITILDDGGKEVATEAFVQKTNGMGEVGEFWGNVEFTEEPDQQTGVVEAYSPSPKDGSKMNLVRVPIVFDTDVV